MGVVGTSIIDLGKLDAWELWVERECLSLHVKGIVMCNKVIKFAGLSGCFSIVALRRLQLLP